MYVLQDMVEVHRAAADKRDRGGSTARSSQVECQPNNAAPLLRDERARREWVDSELDQACQVRVESRQQHASGWQPALVQSQDALCSLDRAETQVQVGTAVTSCMLYVRRNGLCVVGWQQTPLYCVRCDLLGA